MSSSCAPGRLTRWIAGALCGLGLLLVIGGAAGQSGAGTAALLTIDDAIGPATSNYFTGGLERAADSGAAVAILMIDTPGGLDSSMRTIIKAILASEVPVITFVAPSGSRAASAGTYILYASHVAAMAPGTNLGAATPVQIGGAPSPTPQPGGGPPQEPTGEDSEAEDGEAPADTEPLPGTATERKAINDAVAYIRGLAELRGRNVEWAEEAVRSAASLSAASARERNVIDVVATDVADLLRQIDGRTVQIDGEAVTLQTADLIVERIDPTWRDKLLATITNPNIAYLLLLIGLYGLLLEGYSPGALVPGVVGAISLVLAAFAFQVLPVNYAGLALILLGALLIVAEALVPSFGALGIGGVVAFVMGSIILMDTDVPGFGISRTIIGSVAFVGASTAMAILWMAVRARRRPVVSGSEQMIGALAVAERDFDDIGTVFLRGEIWNARTRAPVIEGQSVRVSGMDGLQLEVEPVSPGEKN